MSSIYLDSYMDNASFYLERLLPRAESGRLSWREMQDMASSYRQRGVCAALLTATAGQFHLNMMQSTAAFLHFLPLCPDDKKITSQAKPYFDALCGGYIDAARAIAQHSRATWHEGYEYQEDFLYAWFLMKLLLTPELSSNLESLITQLDKAQAGAEPEHVQMCQALLSKDAALFNATLSLRLAQRRDKVEAMIERGALTEEHWSWLRYFSSEGLALVRLAEYLGIATEPQYLHIPQSLRAPAPFAFNANAWRTLNYSP